MCNKFHWLALMCLCGHMFLTQSQESSIVGNHDLDYVCGEDEPWDECRKRQDLCTSQCEMGSGHGAGFCASFGSFSATIANYFFESYGWSSFIIKLSDSFFWSAAYYCTSGAPYTACTYCGFGTSAIDVLRKQNYTLNEVKILKERGFQGQRMILNISQAMTEALEDASIFAHPLKSSATAVFQAFDNLHYKYKFISQDSNGTVIRDFAFRHFLESATIPSKDGILGIHRRFFQLLIGRGHRGRGRRMNQLSPRYFSSGETSLFEMDREKYCQENSIQFLFSMLFKIREMLFFELRSSLKWKSKSDFYERQCKKYQVRLNEHISRVCGIKPKLDLMTMIKDSNLKHQHV